MNPIESIVPLATFDLTVLLELNNEHAAETSLLETWRLAELIGEACYGRGVAPAKAFLLAFDAAANYESPNFVWFRERYQKFVYIDRVIVAKDSRRQGLAAALYQDLFDWARAAGYGLVGCEVNQEPPNPGSDAFHEVMGFLPAGSGEPSQGKRVRYLVKEL